MEFRRIELQDKPIIEAYLKKQKNMGSENSFTNLYMWRIDYDIRYAVKEDWLFVSLSHPSFGTVYHLPMGEGKMEDGLSLLRKEVGEDIVLCPLYEFDRRKAEELYPEMEIHHRRDMDDYIYRVEDLIDLKGKKYHAKRNHLNYFMNTYAWEYHPITPDKIEECREAVTLWVKERNDAPEEELRAMNDLFMHYEALGVKGAYITVDGEIKAVTVGEEHQGCALIHVEKCDTDIRGIYVAINQMFLSNEFSHLEYVNREEDMGAEGLRKAKLSYHPAFMLEKYLGAWKND